MPVSAAPAARRTLIQQFSMRIGYFGGSFDPPHRGHLAVARAARAHFHLDRILLAPTGSQPLKPNGPVAPWSDRLRMVELLCQGEAALQASTLDAPRPDGLPNYTVDTLRQLRRQLSSTPEPDVAPALAAPPELFAILGADAFQSFPHWREPEALLHIADWIVVSRPGIPLPKLRGHNPAGALGPEERTRVHLLQGVADPLSATDLRAMLRAHQDCTGLIPDRVLAYLRQKHLYGPA